MTERGANASAQEINAPIQGSKNGNSGICEMCVETQHIQVCV